MPDSQRTPGRALPEHVTLPLLDVITRNSLDQDYRHVAEARQRAGTAPERPKQPRRRAAVVVGVFGLLIVTAAVQTSREADATRATREELIQQVSARSAKLREHERTIGQLRDETEQMSRELRRVTRIERAQARETLELAGIAGFTPVRGEGVRIRVDDSPGGDEDGIVQDEDLATLVNGLFAAGAEAVAINGHRITALAGIRTAGSAINIHTVPIRPPYAVLAIGDSGRLQADFVATRSGLTWMGLVNNFDFEFDMDNAESLNLPAARRPELSSATTVPPDSTKEVAP